MTRQLFFSVSTVALDMVIIFLDELIFREEDPEQLHSGTVGGVSGLTFGKMHGSPSIQGSIELHPVPSFHKLLLSVGQKGYFSSISGYPLN
jgi:hypothetical protein